jgi:hypothetical protein
VGVGLSSFSFFSMYSVFSVANLELRA